MSAAVVTLHEQMVLRPAPGQPWVPGTGMVGPLSLDEPIFTLWGLIQRLWKTPDGWNLYGAHIGASEFVTSQTLLKKHF